MTIKLGNVAKAGTKQLLHFMDNIQQAHGCLLWMGKTDKTGFGRVPAGVQGKCIQANRYAYELYFGEIPEGMCVVQSCGNKRCVGKDHLTLLSRGEVNIMFTAKTNGELNVRAKLNEEKVREIRQRYDNTTDKRGLITTLCSEYGLADRSMRLIVNRTTWQHIV